MAGFHGINIQSARQSLLKKLHPAMKAGVDAVVKECEKYLIEKLNVAYGKDGDIRAKASTSIIQRRKGKWDKSWGNSKRVNLPNKQGISTEYPRRRTGSLQASVGSTKAVPHGNIYQSSFGIVRNTFKGKYGTILKKNPTLHNEYKIWQKTKIWRPMKHNGVRPPTPPTLYAKYLEEGTTKMAPRKLVKQAFWELKQSGKLAEIWERSKKREGVRLRVVPHFR